MTRRMSAVLAAIALLLLAAPSRASDPPTANATAASGAPEDLPFVRDSRFYLDFTGMTGIVGPGSIVRVREFRREGTGFHFGDLGMDVDEFYNLDLTAWITRLDAVHGEFRYFDMSGSGFFNRQTFFNGSIIAAHQTLHASPSAWFSFSLFYQRRLTPLLREYERDWPAPLQGWDLIAGIGLAYTYIDFNLSGAKVIAASPGKETKEDFYHQELPAPTLMLDALRKLGDNFTFEASAQMYWLNRWNSLRNEGGTVWASQEGEEFHLKLFYSNPRWLGPIQPMAGFFVYRYSQLEDSHEDGNFMRWSALGPEFGLSWGFL